VTLLQAKSIFTVALLGKDAYSGDCLGGQVS